MSLLLSFFWKKIMTHTCSNLFWSWTGRTWDRIRNPRKKGGKNKGYAKSQIVNLKYQLISISYSISLNENKMNSYCLYAYMLCHAKVSQLNPAIWIYQYICSFNVPLQEKCNFSNTQIRSLEKYSLWGSSKI